MNGRPRTGDAIHRIQIPLGSGPASGLRPEICILDIPSSRYAASLSSRDSCRGNVPRTSRTQGSGCLHEGRSGGQHIIGAQAGDAVDAGSPSRLHLHRTVKVGGSLSVVEPRLIGNPAPSLNAGETMSSPPERAVFATAARVNSSSGTSPRRRTAEGDDGTGTTNTGPLPDVRTVRRPGSAANAAASASDSIGARTVLRSRRSPSLNATSAARAAAS